LNGWIAIVGDGDRLFSKNEQRTTDGLVQISLGHERHVMVPTAFPEYGHSPFGEHTAQCKPSVTQPVHKINQPN
jgi:hypothetical protein